MFRRKLRLSQSHYCKLTHQWQHRVVGEVCCLLLPCCITVFIDLGVERRGELESPCLFGGCADANSACLSRVDNAAPVTTAPLCVCRQAFFPQDNVCRQYIYFTLANPKSHFSTLLFVHFRCRVTVLGKLFTPIVTLFTKQNW